MILGLQRHQRLGAELDRLIEQRDVEVGDADVPRQPLPLGLGQRRHGFGERNLRVRPVHQQEIDIVDLERGEALVDRLREGVGAQIFVRLTLVVRKMSPRGTPEARIASPTARSVPYFQAVSMWR